MSFGVAILILGLLFLLIASPRFRRVAAVALGVVVVAVLLFIGWIHQNEAEQEHKRELAKSYIKSEQIQLVDPRVSFSNYDGRPERISGRIRNDSGYPLERLELRLIFQDCIPKGGCETVGDDKVELSTRVPPQQSRDFEEYILGSALSPKGHVEWSYQIVSVSAATN